MEQVVRFLFKYSGSLLSKGQFGFTGKPSLWLLASGAGAIAILIYFLYSRKGSRLTAGWRALLITLRAALVAVILFCIMRPVVVIPSIVPQSSYVVVLVDDSASMTLPGEGAKTRSDQAKELVGAHSSFAGPLAAKFMLRELKFSETSERLEDASELTAEGERTDLGAALDRAAKETTGLPTSGIIVITDGADNKSASSDDEGKAEQSKLGATLSGLRSRGIPVYAIGLGGASLEHDVELVRATAPRRVLVGSPVTAEVLIKASVGQKTVRIDVTEDNHVLRAQEVPVQNGAVTVARVTFTPSSAGLHKYSLSSPASEDDPAPLNNTQELLLDVSDAKPRILYFEGEPRWEYGKLRESVAEEKNFSLVSVLRSADGKYYRQGIEKPEELAGGFPKSEEQLFKYDALVLGSIEATFFTFDQLRAVEQFVSRRGGTFLALGGSKSFGGGGYGNTPIADMLPVSISDATPAQAEVEAFKAAPADRGRDHPAARLKDDAGENEKAWEHLPAITLPQVIGETKPGATIILEARDVKDRNRAVPLLVEERYGRGRSMALTASDTWRWRMMLEFKDQSFETFWRNLFRYSVEGVRHPVEVTTERGLYGRAERVVIKADVNDEKFERVRDAAVSARIVGPGGNVTELKLNRSASAGGDLYIGEALPTEEGSYHIDVTARKSGNQGGELGSAETNFLVGALNSEFRNAGQNVELLKRIASESGGGYYTADQAGGLIEDITHTEGPSSIRETKELWDMPINFLLIVGLAAGEWFIRKRKGLA